MNFIKSPRMLLLKKELISFPKSYEKGSVGAPHKAFILLKKWITVFVKVYSLSLWKIICFWDRNHNI